MNDPFGVLVVLAVVAWISIWAEKHVPGGRYLGSVLLAILLAAVLANTGVLPSSSDAYGWLGGVGVEVGIVLILLGVDIHTVKRAGPRMLGAFGLGAAGTAVGAMVGALIFSGWVGPETWKLAGQYTGTYTGGSVNFVAVGQAVQTDPDLYTAAVAADNVTTTLWMGACLLIPTMLAALWPRASTGGTGAGATDAAVEAFTRTGRPVELRDVAILASVVGVVVVAARALGAAVPAIPSVLWLTTFALVLAQIPWTKSLAGGPLFGNYLMHLFLATIGAQSIFSEILRVGPAVFYFTVVVVGVHGLVVFGFGRMLRIDLPTLAVASQANVGGPASAMALGAARGYSDRILPGVAVGLLGYAVGNYTGIAVANLMRGVLGS